MINPDLNKQINALWDQLPENLNLDEKFYAYVTTGKLKELKELIEQYPLLEQIAKLDESLILGPAYHYHYKMVDYLVTELGFDVEHPRQEAINRTLLLEILYRHHTLHHNVNLSSETKFSLKYQTIETLLALHANVNAVDYCLGSSLHYAIKCIQLDDLLNNYANQIINLLLENGADPNKQDNWGKTSLHILLSDAQYPLNLLEPIIKLLIDHGADETITDKNCITPKIMVLGRSAIRILS